MIWSLVNKPMRFATISLMALLTLPQPAGSVDMTHSGYVPHPEWFKASFLDLAEDIEDATQSNRHVMLYFYQDGCPYCKLFIENVLGQHDIAEYTQQNFDMIAINIFGSLDVTDPSGESAAESAFSMNSQVMFTPTVLVYGPDQSVVFRMNGYYPPSKFRAATRFIAERRYKHERFLKYYRGQNKIEATGQLHTEVATLSGSPLDLSNRDLDKPLLVLFEQKVCRDCDELHSDIFKRGTTRALLDQFEVAVVDLRAPDPIITPEGIATDVPEFVETLGVKVVPTQVLFDGSGREVFRSEGYLRSFHVQSMLDYVASGRYQQDPDFQHYLSGRADHLREQRVEIDIME